MKRQPADRETVELLDELLSRLSKKDPYRARRITQMVKVQGFREFQAKCQKLRIWGEEDNQHFRLALTEVLTLSKFSTIASSPKLSGIYENIFRISKGARANGSFESKENK